MEILEIKNIITEAKETKTSVNGLNRRERTEERISKFEAETIV